MNAERRQNLARIKDSRAQASYFLEEVHRRADHYAERIDPETRRAYDKDPVLKALDGILLRARDALDQFRPDWRETSWPPMGHEGRAADVRDDHDAILTKIAPRERESRDAGGCMLCDHERGTVTEFHMGAFLVRVCATCKVPLIAALSRPAPRGR